MGFATLVLDRGHDAARRQGGIKDKKNKQVLINVVYMS